MPSSDNCTRSSCPLACGLDLLGDKWSMLIIRDLLLTNRQEYGHFLNSGEGISTNILSNRLEKLQAGGLMIKTAHPEHGKKFIYSLTEKGRSLAPVLIEIALWADQHVEGAKLPEVLVDLFKDKEATAAKLLSGDIQFDVV